MARHVREQVEVLRKAEGALEAAVLFALAELGVFVALGSDERSVGEIAAATGCDSARLERMLNGGVIVGVLERTDAGRYRAGPAYAATLSAPEAPQFLGDWLAFLGRLTDRMLSLAEAAKPGGLRAHWPDDERDGAVMAKAMESYARARGLEITERLDLSGDSRLVDLGCGSGAYSIALAERFPNVFLTLVDLPEVAPTLATLLESRPAVAGRSEIVAADVLEFEPDKPYDVVLLSNMLHMFGPERAPLVVEHARRVLRPGGRLIIQAQFLEESRMTPRWSVLLDVILMATTPEGANHSVDETRGWMERAGFEGITRVETPLWNVCDALVGINPLT